MKINIIYIIYILIICFSGCTRKQQIDKDKYEQLLSFRNSGLAYIEEEQYLNAVNQFKSFIDIAPFEASGYANLGWSYLQLPDKLDSAEFYLLEAAKLSKNNSDISFIVAKMYELTDRKPAAIKQLQSIINYRSDHILSLYQLYEYYRTPGERQNLNKAEKLLLQLLELAPGNIAVHLKMVDLSIKNGHLEKALFSLESIRQILPSIPEETNSYLNESIQLLRNNNQKKSMVQSLIFHNLLKPTTFYKSGIQELKGGSGPIAGAPITNLTNLNISEFYDNKNAISSIQFIDITNQSRLDSLNNIHVLIRGDYDLDGDDDLFISLTDERQSTDQLILINENGVFKRIDAKINHPGVDYFAVSHDYDNDGHIDIIIINSLGIKIYKNNGFAEFVDMSKSSGIYINNYPNNLGFFDYDLEGDLDMYISSNGNNQLFRNNSDGTFTDISTDSDVMANGENTLNQVFGDFDDDGDVDMIVLNENNSIVYYDNIRQGYFRDLTKNSGLSHNGKPSSINVADYNNDGYLDIYISDLEGSHSLYKNNGEGRFIYDSKFLQTNNFLRGFSAQHSEFADIDNDGHLDIIIAGGPIKESIKHRGIILLHNNGTGEFNDVSSSLPLIEHPVNNIVSSDFDNDGDIDLILLQNNNSIVLRNDGGNLNNYLKVRLAGLRAGSSKNNYFGIGSKLELKAGGLYQMRSVNRAVSHFGIGDRSQGDVIRVLWSNGVPQNHLNPKKNQTIVETQILKGSCQYLFAWDGSKFDFVTDVLWPSALGMPLGIMAGEKLFAFPNSTDEYLKVSGNSAKPRNGCYELNFTTELWETPYLDNIKLMVVDHPDSIDIYINEKFTPPPYPPFRIYRVSDKISPIGAIDNLGNDLRKALLLPDKIYTNHLTPSAYQGITEAHDMILDFGDLENLDSVYLFMKGWLFPTDASINVNVSQSGITNLLFPSLQVVNKDGEWESVYDNIGFPKGKNKTMIVNLSDKFISDDYRIRIQTNMQIYWDHIFISSDVSNKNITISELQPIYANLHYRGFSEISKENFSSPHIPDYYNIVTKQKWRDLTGRYTKYGDILSLLLKSDNKYVIMNSGDEISLKFPETSLDKLSNGWERDFLFYNDGWLKDGDLNTAQGQTASPLPFHGMLSYPPKSNDSLSIDNNHNKYMKTYNTRNISTNSFKNEIRNYNANK